MIGYLSHQVASTSASSSRAQGTVLRFEAVLAVLVELAGGAVERQRDVGARRVAGTVDRLDEQLQRGLVARQVRREAAFVADRRRHPALVDHLLQRVEDLGTVAQRLAEARRADRHQHELLHVDRVVGVGAAVDDVHQRHRQLHLAGATQVTVQRQRRLVGAGLGDRAGDGEDRVGAEPSLVVGAVQLDQRVVDEALLAGVQAEDRFADLRVDVLDGAHDALAVIARGVAVAQLHGFLRARRGARWHRGAAGDARLEYDVGFDGGVAARIEDLAGDDVDDGAHVVRDQRSGIRDRMRRCSARFGGAPFKARRALGSSGRFVVADHPVGDLAQRDDDFLVIGVAARTPRGPPAWRTPC